MSKKLKKKKKSYKYLKKGSVIYVRIAMDGPGFRLFPGTKTTAEFFFGNSESSFLLAGKPERGLAFIGSPEMSDASRNGGPLGYGLYCWSRTPEGPPLTKEDFGV